MAVGWAVTGNGGRGGSQTYLGLRAPRRAVPGDMMMYWVPSRGGGCGRWFFQAVRAAWCGPAA